MLLLLLIKASWGVNERANPHRVYVRVSCHPVKATLHKSEQVADVLC